MAKIDITAEQAAEIAAIVERDSRRIDRAANKMLKLLVGMEPVSQKQALCQALAIWVRAMEREERAFDLSAAMHHQVDLNLAASFDVKSATH
ncbi:MAG: hypothetical protein AB7P20_20430 [Rhizobiaceae bacterium]